MTKHYRQIITYHSELGHLYVPNLHTRIRYGSGAYFLQTDELGFRNSSFEKEGALRILLLGDSYAAGDGVSNQDRFGDLLQSQFNCTVTNLAVNGYGLDQQVMIYERFKDQIPHDLVILAPHMDDFYRSMADHRVGQGRDGKGMKIPKPFFELDEAGQLVMKNVPVPREREEVELSTAEQEMSSANKVKNKIKYALNRAGIQVGKRSFPELNDPDSNEWKLAKALLDRLLNLAEDKDVVVMPLPYNYIVANNEPQSYKVIFKEVLSDRARLLDPLPSLSEVYKKLGDETFLPLCGHFSSAAHSEFTEWLGAELQLERRPDGEAKLKEKKTGFVLGISCFYHDSAAAIIQDGKIVAAAQEERFTRIKHDKAFPENAIHFCLEEARLDINELEAICYYDDEAWTIERVVANMAALPEEKSKSFWESGASGVFRKLSLKKQLSDIFGYTGPLFKTKHHHSHAASAYYPSPFDDAAIVVVDGVGEWACATIGHGKGSKVELLKQQNYPHSIGLLYSAITYFCGFKVNSGEYKLMGLAPYGEPTYADLMKKELVSIGEDGSIRLNMKYFSFLSGEKMTADAMAEIFDGPERPPESQITKREMDLAASVQAVTEEIMEKILIHAKELTGSDYCVLAGGVALNCVANGKLVKDDIFKDIWVQPAAGDAGGALGAAFDYYYQKMHIGDAKAQGSTQTHSYYGPSFSSSEIQAFLETQGAKFHETESTSKQIADWVTDGKVVGYFDGAMEFGPRALAHRSFLADATNTEMQKKVNLKVKYRESFRPFAPILAEENVSEYFDFDRPSPFMLMVSPVKKELQKDVDGMKGEDMIETVNQVRSTLPAITHVDYSARLQTVNDGDNLNPKIHRALKEVEKKTGYAVMINTSFNVRGEPIVCTPEDAYRCFMRTETDVLVLGDYFLYKTEQPNWEETEKWEESFLLD